MMSIWPKVMDHIENGSGPVWIGCDFGIEMKEESKMKIDRVTMTGADDSINPNDLIEISAEYPFVEWGILFSRSQEGRARFPHIAWVDAYIDVARENDFQSSAHLCGQDVRELLTGCELSFWRRLNERPSSKAGMIEHKHITDAFDRVQLNFHAEKHPPHPDFIAKISRLPHQFILQMDGVNEKILSAALDQGVSNIYPLFDLSGGAGIVPEAWPVALDDVYCGYAGGLGPDNIEAELERIAVAAKGKTIWIDMETKIRSDDDRKFDLDKVIACLEKAKPYVA